MGTRSLTHIVDNNGVVLTTLYIQYDGYPDGVGQDLFNLVNKVVLTNGFAPGAKAGEVANGMGCMAAQIVSNLKTEVGNVYMYPPMSLDCGEEYTYFVIPVDDKIVDRVPILEPKLGGVAVICRDGAGKMFAINNDTIDANGFVASASIDMNLLSSDK